MMSEPSINALYAGQEQVYSLLCQTLGESFREAKLCGGTPLARCYLNHRISYDLDVFLQPGHGLVEAMGEKLHKAGVGFMLEQRFAGQGIYAQLFGRIATKQGQEISLSLIEDRWFSLFPSVRRPMGQIAVCTEPIEGLYHRKIRTVAGYGDGEAPVGGRQTARDLFDLYVLSRSVKPIPAFLADLRDTVSEDAFYTGLANMNWVALADELGRMRVADQWAGLLELDAFVAEVTQEAGMTTIEPEAEPEDDNGPECRL